MTTASLRAAESGGKTSPEVLGEWTTGTGNRLTLMARKGTGYASTWLNYRGQPVKIGYALHSGGVVRSVSWEEPWRDQTEAWKAEQRRQIASLIAAWYAEQPLPTEPDPLPASVVGTFDVDGFRFAVEPQVAADQALLSVLNVAGGLTPVADLLHDAGGICGMVTRPGWQSTPDDRKRRWRREAEAILTRAAEHGRV
ncbi:hypothetical protein [Glycomyces salinus]|uniref:hypothetical protein n=1 Tax=Glycomyces salinus TaxID=980294 RepID=UPI0018EC3F34|nr:hypothetical protein [Glycomyces salinus]